MNTVRHIFTLSLLAAVATLLVVAPAGCAKKCQGPPEQPFKTFIDTEWRMVETTNPQLKDLSQVNFLIMSWAINFAGAVYKVENNDRQNNPVLSFIYNVDASRKLIRQQFQSVPTQEGEAPTNVGNVVTYSYTLGSGLLLTEKETGYTYRFVQFSGVVRPDENCTF